MAADHQAGVERAAALVTSVFLHASIPDSSALAEATPLQRRRARAISRNGTPIGRLIPLRRRIFVPLEEVMAAFATAPALDAERFRARH